MRKSIKGFELLLSFIVLSAVITTAKAQPGCPNINAGPDKIVNCTSTCATLNATVLETGASTSYNVSSVPYAPPYPYNSGTQIMANIDDTWSTPIVLPFNFCFFGNVYNQIVVGSNGLVSFNTALSGAFCGWSYSATCPSTSLALNSIFGPYHDIDPSIGGALYYGIQGASPCRTFVISFYNVPLFSSSCNSILATHQIVLYENTNVIEVYMQNKPKCPTWNSGNAVVGIQNSTGTVGYTPPGRNTSQWTATNEAWRFTPSGTPNFSVAWFNGATQIGTNMSVSVCPTVNTTYTGKVTYTNCDAIQIVIQDQVNVSVVNNLALNASATTPSFCAGNNTNITATGAASYVWSPSTGLSSTNTATVNASPTTSTSYQVVGTLGVCVDSTIVNLNVTPGPVVTLTNSETAVCAGASSVLTASGATSYSWSPSASLSASIGTSVTATPSATTTYTVTGTTSGCSGTASSSVTVNLPPTAIIGSNSPICSGNDLNLTSSGGASYLWSGPNGFSNSSQNPTITNSVALYSGVYTVTVTGSTGCTSTAQTTVVVNQTPSVTVSCNSPICQNSMLSLTSDGGTGYCWSGPTGYTCITQNPSISSSTTLNSGVYTVTVTGAGGCTSTGQTTVVVNPNPTAVAGSNSPICQNTPLNLTSSGGTGYSWSGPVTLLNPTTATPSLSSSTVPSSGNYVVTVTGVGGCTSTAQTTVVVNPKPVVVVSPVSLQICLGRDTLLTASGATTYFWTPAINVTPTTGATTTITPTSNITYTVHGTTEGCIDSASVVVTVVSNPAIQINPNTVSICQGENASLTATGGIAYLWSPSSTLSSGSGGVVTATPSSTTVYTVIGTTSGCSGTASATVTIKPNPQLSFAPQNPAICYGGSLSLTASGATTYLWSPDSTLSSNTGTVVSAHPLANTNYRLVGTLDGCKDSIQIPFVVNPLPVIMIDAQPPSGCEAFSTVISASSTPSASVYNWNLGNGTTSTQANPSVTYANAGQYSVSLTIIDVNQCTNNINYPDLITVYPKPVVDYTMSSQEVYIQQEVVFTSSYTESGAQYVWSFGDGDVANVNTSVVMHGYPNSNLYNVVHTVITEFGCTNSTTHEISVIVKIDIPNIFTPNADGYNDLFVIEGLQYVENASIKIYNRWGRKVYESDSYKGNWDGGDFASGVYFYVLTLPEYLKAGPFNGSVNLLR